MEWSENFPLQVVHFNFGLRGEESEEDQKFVQELAAKYEVPLYIRKVSLDELTNRTEKNTQAWARSIRIQTFEHFIKEGWILALAHQKDDLAENILLRMARGVSPGSLVGMSEWHAPYWRPLLGQGKEQILDWLNSRKLPYRQDSSNDKMIYSRNVIRHRVLPELKKLNVKARDHIVRCARETQDFVYFTRSTLLERKDGEGQSLADLPKGIAYDVLSCRIGRPEKKGINHNILEQALDAVSRPGKKTGKQLAQLPDGKGLFEKDGKMEVAGSVPIKEKPRYKQHAASIFSEERAIILGPSAIVDFFPIPAGTVLDQNFRVCNSDPVAKKFSGV